MRSRYSAFALAQADYLAATALAPTTDAAREELRHWASEVVWLGLQVLEARDNEVEFVARYLEGERVVSLRERSTFVLHDGRWLYASGTPQVTAERVGRNELCPCGTGKKFKLCRHGR